MLTYRTVLFVTTVTVVGLPDTLIAAMLRMRAIALTLTTFDSPSACC